MTHIRVKLTQEALHSLNYSTICHISFLLVVHSSETITVIKKSVRKVKYDTLYNWYKL
jgi:hypothetical protein